jgi:hypothetical protein
VNAFAGIIVASVGSSTVIWGLLQWFLATRERNAKRRVDEKQEVQRDEREAKRRIELLAEAQATAQRTALDSANERYLALQHDYEQMRSGLREIKKASALMLNAFEGFLLRLRPNSDGETYSAIIEVTEVDLARRTIHEAREHLFR